MGRSMAPKRLYYVLEERVLHCLTPTKACSHRHHHFLASAAREAFSTLRREWHITAEGEIERCLERECSRAPHFLRRGEVVRHHRATYDFSGPWRPLANPYVSLLEEEVATLVERLGYRVERNTRTVIGPSELDLFLPEAMVALEVNGDHWHGPEVMEARYQTTPQAYHRGKKVRCEEQGVMLAFLWESNWLQDWETCLDALCDFIQFRRYDPLLVSLSGPRVPMDIYWERCDRLSMERSRAKVTKRREKLLEGKAPTRRKP